MIINIKYTKIEPTDRIETRFEPRLVLDYNDVHSGRIEIYHVLFSRDGRKGQILCVISKEVLGDPVFDMTAFLRNIISSV